MDCGDTARVAGLERQEKGDGAHTVPDFLEEQPADPHTQGGLDQEARGHAAFAVLIVVERHAIRMQAIKPAQLRCILDRDQALFGGNRTQRSLADMRFSARVRAANDHRLSL